ncbi:MAG: Tol-Pal system beta propeller repeat protein TolB [Gammaproteobacteria bacterium]|nr:Tol-Pal system beta propeller repeat protein TolB [Gammaproteobacteria bacterium]
MKFLPAAGCGPLAVLAALSLAAFPAPARAQIEVVITQGVEKGVPVAVVPFGWSGKSGAAAPPVNVSGVISDNLRGSGRFELALREDFLDFPHNHDQVKFSDWSQIGVDHLVIGNVHQLGEGRYRVRFQLFDVHRRGQIAAIQFIVPQSRLRRSAHKISDIIFEKLTGIRGAFDTRIAFVSVAAPGAEQRYALNIADYDGRNAQTVFRSSEPVLSPVWSPDGEQLAYVTFEKRHSVVYIQHLKNGTRRKLPGHPGLNSAPAWSADGRRMALSLSRDGNPEIYVHDFASGDLRRLTRHTAIDTEPAWSPDGRHIVFTSNRSGSPQIYRISASGRGRPQRLTFEGSYNAGAVYAPDGGSLALVSNVDGEHRVGVLFLDSDGIFTLSDTRLDESPAFAPNGEAILYATKTGPNSILASVSKDGRTKKLITRQDGGASVDLREPAWSPFNR